MSDLTDKQQLFVTEYLVDLNATQAAIRAGYSKKTARSTACVYLAKPNIAAAIAKAFDARSERTEITQDSVVEGLRAEALRTGEGASHAARVSAWSWLGRHLGMFTERVQVSGEIVTTTKDMSDDELLERADQLANRLAVHVGASSNGDGS